MPLQAGDATFWPHRPPAITPLRPRRLSRIQYARLLEIPLGIPPPEGFSFD